MSYNDNSALYGALFYSIGNVIVFHLVGVIPIGTLAAKPYIYYYYHVNHALHSVISNELHVL